MVTRASVNEVRFFGDLPVARNFGSWFAFLSAGTNRPSTPTRSIPSYPPMNLWKSQAASGFLAPVGTTWPLPL